MYAYLLIFCVALDIGWKLIHSQVKQTEAFSYRRTWFDDPLVKLCWSSNVWEYRAEKRFVSTWFSIQYDKSADPTITAQLVLL